MHFYNEHDPYAAEWLRNLIREGLIPNGVVDERSIVDVTADDVRSGGLRHRRTIRIRSRVREWGWNVSRVLIRSLVERDWTLPEGDWQKHPSDEQLALACALQVARQTQLATKLLRELVEETKRVPAVERIATPAESLASRQAASRERAAEAYRKAGGTMDLSGDGDADEPHSPKPDFYETVVTCRRNTGLRLYWAVHFLGVKSFEEMARLKESQLLRQKGVGAGALQLAKQLLAERGLSFSPES